MNEHARDAVIGLGVCGVIITAMLVTHSLDVLWLLFLLIFLAF